MTEHHSKLQVVLIILLLAVDISTLNCVCFLLIFLLLLNVTNPTDLTNPDQ